MVVLICGASHTGKTLLAQRLLEQYHYPVLSIDHLKMGLIRSGYTKLTPLSEEAALTEYLWPIVREMVKTAIENKQNLIVEGCYIPGSWADDFEPQYLAEIRCVCLVMSEHYIRNHIADIQEYANAIEQRLDDDCTLEGLLADNRSVFARVQQEGFSYILIDRHYEQDLQAGLNQLGL